MLPGTPRNHERNRKWWAADSAVAFLCGGFVALAIAGGLMAWGPFSAGFCMLGVAAAQFATAGYRALHGRPEPSQPAVR